ncbi:hypothetical protein R50073_08600 [Maricurvus nonylphenolicus]|uniref:carboxypeptidase regulatory-like domain-containing protein n=1 Tax=Maricurvus nonylphenolicus TaxID=1008307 RepID=UPI0036F2D3F0
MLRITKAIAAIVFATGLTPSALAATTPLKGDLFGTITSADGTPMEGVAVTAQAESASFKTSVFTDANGHYYFPELNNGTYKVWAQAIGYKKADDTVSYKQGNELSQDFTMKSIDDFSKQLSGDMWIESLPDSTPEDARMKQIVYNTCTTCHTGGYLLSKRFDEEGWNIIIDAMINYMTRPGAKNRALMKAYKGEIASYLGKVRGDEDLMNYTGFPRISGDATKVVVTEYDIPKGNDPGFVQVPDGSNWELGSPGRGGEALHDVVPGNDGYAYFSDNVYPDRTIGRLDPQTGEVTNFVVPHKKLASRTHAVMNAANGDIWANNYSNGEFIKLDADAEKIITFPKPKGGLPVGGHVEITPDGIIFASSNKGGVVKLDPKTGEYTDYIAPTPGGKPYGVAADRLGNMWMLNLGNDRIMWVDGKTGEIEEIKFPPVAGISEKDLNIAKTVNPNGADGNAAPIHLRGPRRAGGDPKGDYIWIALYWSGEIARINIHTKDIKIYPVPSRYSHPYDIQVDKNQMVWTCQHNGDRLSKFNPETEEFTEYPLPSIGHECRHLSVDNSTEIPTIWIAYSGSAKVARVQFRTDTSK